MIYPDDQFDLFKRSSVLLIRSLSGGVFKGFKG